VHSHYVFENPPALPHDIVLDILSRALAGDEDQNTQFEAASALVGIALKDDDRAFVERCCLEVGARAEPGSHLLGLAGLCLGHSARRFGTLSGEAIALADSLAARAKRSTTTLTAVRSMASKTSTNAGTGPGSTPEAVLAQGGFFPASLFCVASETSYLCHCCGERHDGLPMSYGTDAPAYWDPSLADNESSMLEQEQCIIKAEHFFIRGRLVIAVTDAPPGTEFDWGVWVSLSRDNFARALSLWTTAGREQEPPCFGWLSTDLPIYQPSTLSLKTQVHTQTVGKRPLIELEPTDHPLAAEQRTGITLARVQEIAETLLHTDRSPA
jgi:hypothetical protein